MPKSKSPRKGSMQYWPRKRAKKEVARVRAWADVKKTQLLGFAGYKSGMTHILINDNRKNSLTKGEKISVPVTIIECPPIRILSARFYKNIAGKNVLLTEVLLNSDKTISKRLSLPKEVSGDLDSVKVEEFDYVRVSVYTQPQKTTIGKKIPEVFEVALGGKKEEALAYIKENVGKDIAVSDIFQAGQYVDTHSVTIGKGYQGPVKRFGVAIRQRKSEKTKRGPGSISGGWIAQGHMMYRVAHAGQMGYHLRTEYNKQIFMIGNKPEEVNPKGGIIHYGNVKNSYILIKGSVGGPKKRLIRFNFPIRKNPKSSEEAPQVVAISQESHQGR